MKIKIFIFRNLKALMKGQNSILPTLESRFALRRIGKKLGSFRICHYTYYNFSYVYESLYTKVCEKTEHAPIIPRILVIMKLFNGRMTLIFNPIYIFIPEKSMVLPTALLGISRQVYDRRKSRDRCQTSIFFKHKSDICQQ